MKKVNKNLEKVANKFAALMIEQMQEIEKDWTRPWIKVKKKNFLPQNISGRHYSGGNTLMLLLQLMFTGYITPVFLTFKQAKDMDLHIHKGSHSFPVYHFLYMYYNPSTYDRITESELIKLPDTLQADYLRVPSIRVFDVFNLDQTDYAEKYPEAWTEKLLRFSENVPLNDGEMFFDPFLDQLFENQEWVCPIDIRLSNSAYYSPSEDRIVLPVKTQFNDGQGYYTTGLHEMTHSTGIEDRLKRYKNTGSRKSEEYAREELVAELCAALMAYYMGIESTIRQDHTAYLRHWINQMKKSILNRFKNKRKPIPE